MLFFFSRPFHENFKFLKNCPNDFHEFLHSHSTPKGAPACAKASKSYGWDVRNIAKIRPKMAKKNSLFSIFSQTVLTIRTKASQKEKDSSRLLYRICGSGYILNFFSFFIPLLSTLFLKKRTVRTETHFSCWCKLRKEPVDKRRASREQLKRVSYTLQAAEPPCSVTNGPI